LISRRLTKRRGAAAVEFALVAQVMFVLIFGIIEIGRALMVVHLLSDVARDSARYAVVTEGSNKSSDTIKTYASNRMAAYGLSTTIIPVVSVSDSSSTNLSTTTGPSQQTGSSNFGKYTNGTEVTVQVQVNYSDVTWLPFATFLANSSKLTGQYTFRRDPM
jgi:Flp pilus assembly protein TadG